MSKKLYAYICIYIHTVIYSVHIYIFYIHIYIYYFLQYKCQINNYKHTYYCHGCAAKTSWLPNLAWKNKSIGRSQRQDLVLVQPNALRYIPDSWVVQSIKRQFVVTAILIFEWKFSWSTTKSWASWAIQCLKHRIDSVLTVSLKYVTHEVCFTSLMPHIWEICKCYVHAGF